MVLLKYKIIFPLPFREGARGRGLGGGGKYKIPHPTPSPRRGGN